MRMRKLLVPIVGGLLATLVTAGAASATSDSPPGPPEIAVAVEGRDDHPIPEKVRKAHKAFIQCLRDNGVDVEEAGDEDRWKFRIEVDEDEREAFEACHKKFGRPVHKDRFVAPGIPPKRLEKLEGRIQEMHACLREHGVDVPEVDEPTGDAVFDRLQWLKDLDEDERAELKEALEACGGDVPPGDARLPDLPKLRS